MKKSRSKIKGGGKRDVRRESETAINRGRGIKRTESTQTKNRQNDRGGNFDSFSLCCFFCIFLFFFVIPPGYSGNWNNNVYVSIYLTEGEPSVYLNGEHVTQCLRVYVCPTMYDQFPCKSAASPPCARFQLWSPMGGILCVNANKENVLK